MATRIAAQCAEELSESLGIGKMGWERQVEFHVGLGGGIELAQVILYKRGFAQGFAFYEIYFDEKTGDVQQYNLEIDQVPDDA